MHTMHCLSKNTRNRYPEMLYFYLKMQQNAFGGRAPPGPAGGAYSAHQTL